jgi:phenylpropionate dioxygenase-like ring-hydroxylating dioxygenase large terminal subunit
MPDDVAMLTADVTATAALPLPQARLLPPGAYTSEAFFSAEEERVFRAGWLCLAHVSELPEAGDYLAIDILGEPLAVTRARDGQVHVLSRICAHRAMDIIPGGTGFPRRGHAAALVCPYHVWTYEFDGRLRGCPHMQNAENFTKSDWPLTALRSEIWNGFVFVNFDGKAAPVATHYADLDEQLAPWKIAEMGLAITMEWDCEFNWKIMVENWMESYHHIGAHSTTLNPIMPGQNTWIEPEHPHYIHAHLPYTAALQAEVAAAQARGEAMPGFLPIAGLSEAQQTEWGLFLGLPCFMFLTMPDRLLWYRLLPLAAGKCRLQTMTLVSRETLASPVFPQMVEAETPLLRDFHLEDMVMNTAVQQGLRSRYAVRGRLSHLEEPVWLIQRYLAARLNGTLPERAARKPYYGPRAAG